MRIEAQMFLAAGDIDLKRHSELMETYQVRGFERDLRDDLIELQTNILLNLSRIIVAYADKYGTDPELGVYPQEGANL